MQREQYQHHMKCIANSNRTIGNVQRTIIELYEMYKEQIGIKRKKREWDGVLLYMQSRGKVLPLKTLRFK